MSNRTLVKGDAYLTAPGRSGKKRDSGRVINVDCDAAPLHRVTPGSYQAKECSPGVVSPPLVATWIVFVSQSNASGVPCRSGAVIFVRFHGGFESSLLKPFQSPAKTSGKSFVIICLPKIVGIVSSVH